MRNAAKIYEATNARALTQESPPEQLIVLLFEKAHTCLSRAAMLPMETLDELPLTERLAVIEDFQKGASKALEIILTLRGILDTDSHDGISSQLHETYTVIAKSILNAMKPVNLVEIKKLRDILLELKKAWQQAAMNARSDMV